MNHLSVLLGGLWITLKISGGAWLLSIVGGLVIAAIRDFGPKPLAWFFDFVVTALRSVPELVLLYLIFFGLPAAGINLGSLTATIIALGAAESAFTSEYFRASISVVPESQRRAGESVGISDLGVFRYVVLPQAVPMMFPPALNCFVSLLKTSTLASAVGAPEILYQGQEIMNNTGDIFGIALFIVAIYVIVTLPLTTAVGYLETRVRQQAARA